MLNNGEIDFESFQKLLERQVKAGNALTILGSTGEAPSFSLEEKKEILDFVINMKLNTPLMVGIGGMYLPDQVSWINYLNSVEVDAYLVPVPYYTKPGKIGQTKWFTKLLDASQRPVCIYNVPGRAAAPLHPDALKLISKHENFWAIKEASGSVEDFKSYLHHAPNAHMLSGDDVMFAKFSRLGCRGVVSVAANVWPTQTNKIASQFIENNFENEELFVAASKSLFSASNPIPTKAFLAREGNIKTPITRPPLSADDIMDLENIIEISEKIKLL